MSSKKIVRRLQDSSGGLSVSYAVLVPENSEIWVSDITSWIQSTSSDSSSFLETLTVEVSTNPETQNLGLDFSEWKVEFSQEWPKAKSIAEVNDEIVIFVMIDDWIWNNELDQMLDESFVEESTMGERLVAEIIPEWTWEKSSSWDKKSSTTTTTTELVTEEVYNV